MTSVSLDPADYAEAAANFNSIKSGAVLRGLTLGRELNRYDNMAGTDDGGQAFASEYDVNASSIVQALDLIAIRASEYDAGLMATASSHYLADQAAAGNVAAASI